MASEHIPKSFKIVEGLRIPVHFDVDKFRSSLQYKAQPGDIFIATYAKSGTTWMETIVFGLLNKGQPFDDDIAYYIRKTPFLERVGEHVVNTMIPPGSIKTHLPIDRIPYHPQAKYICVIRNPKDICVSFYYFLSKIPVSQYFECTFSTFFNDFLQGQVPYGDYFEYLRSLWSYKDHENVLIISYEMMKRDIRCIIQKVAQFLNIELIGQEELLDRVMAFSSFEYMKKNLDKLRNDFCTKTTTDIKPFSYAVTIIRRGTVGDWKSCMNEEQSQQFDKVLAEKIQDMPGLETFWQ